MNYSLALFCIAIVVAVPADSDSLGPPTIAGCPIFPANNIWNTPVNQLPVDPNSAAWVNKIGLGKGLHPDFGSGTWGLRRARSAYRT